MWYVTYRHTKTTAAHTVAVKARGRTSDMNVGRASSARPEDPGVGLIIMTVHIDNCRAQMPNWLKESPSRIMGTRNAIKRALRVRKRAVQLTAVAAAAWPQARHDMVRKSSDALCKSRANCRNGSLHREKGRCVARDSNPVRMRLGAPNKAVLRKAASTAMKA